MQRTFVQAIQNVTNIVQARENVKRLYKQDNIKSICTSKTECNKHSFKQEDKHNLSEQL